MTVTFGLRPIVALMALGSAQFCTIDAQAADARHPVVVELYTSQGCSSCPPANANFAALADRPDVLALSFGVTYWDQLGWKDTFASPQYTARQWDYARGLRHPDVFTPQVVVNGRIDGVGVRPGEIEALMRRGDRGAGPETVVSAAEITVGPGAAPAQPATVWLVRYDPGAIEVPVARGENAGRTLPHRHVVRELIRLGAWSGRAQSWRPPAPTRPGLVTAVLVQAGPGGPILAAGKG